MTEDERESVINAIVSSEDAPEYLITKAHAEDWRRHLRRHIPCEPAINTEAVNDR